MGHAPSLPGQQTGSAAATKRCRLRALTLSLQLGVGALAYAQTADRPMYGVFDHVASESLSLAGVRIQYAETPGTIAASS
jgi:hypothetical protein